MASWTTGALVSALIAGLPGFIEATATVANIARTCVATGMVAAIAARIAGNRQASFNTPHEHVL